MTIGFNEEILSGLLLPSQYNSLVRGKRYETSEAEKGLLQAVLEDAIRTYLSDRNTDTGPRRVRFAETKRWFEDSVDDGARGPFAYESVCDALGIDPDLLRCVWASIKMHTAQGAVALESRSHESRGTDGESSDANTCARGNHSGWWRGFEAQ